MTCLFYLMTASFPAFALTADDVATAVKNTYDKLTQTAKPLFNPDKFKETPASTDPFFDKIKKKREAFFKKRCEDQKKFFDKARGKNWDRETLQEELRKFQQGQKDKMDKFMEKQQEKINKHNAKA